MRHHLTEGDQDLGRDVSICILLTRSNIVALERAKATTTAGMTISVRRAIETINLEAMYLDIVDLSPSQARKVQLRLSKKGLRRLKLIATRRRCSLDLLVNNAIAKHVHARIDNKALQFEPVALDPRIYKLLQKVARQRRVSIELLINSALRAYHDKVAPLKSFHAAKSGASLHIEQADAK